jgi:hypothetical protein
MQHLPTGRKSFVVNYWSRGRHRFYTLGQYGPCRHVHRFKEESREAPSPRLSSPDSATSSPKPSWGTSPHAMQNRLSALREPVASPHLAGSSPRRGRRPRTRSGFCPGLGLDSELPLAVQVDCVVDDTEEHDHADHSGDDSISLSSRLVDRGRPWTASAKGRARIRGGPAGGSTRHLSSIF